MLLLGWLKYYLLIWNQANLNDEFLSILIHRETIKVCELVSNFSIWLSLQIEVRFFHMHFISEVNQTRKLHFVGKPYFPKAVNLPAFNATVCKTINKSKFRVSIRRLNTVYLNTNRWSTISRARAEEREIERQRERKREKSFSWIADPYFGSDRCNAWEAHRSAHFRICAAIIESSRN